MRGTHSGDAAGRQISAIIKAMWHNNTRRILWVSFNNDLRPDARRDMMDMCAATSMQLSVSCLSPCVVAYGTCNHIAIMRFHAIVKCEVARALCTTMLGPEICRNIRVPSGGRKIRGPGDKPTIDVWPKGSEAPPTDASKMRHDLRHGGVFFCSYHLLIAGSTTKIKENAMKKDKTKRCAARHSASVLLPHLLARNACVRCCKCQSYKMR